jgi:hypothetical protein
VRCDQDGKKKNGISINNIKEKIAAKSQRYFEDLEADGW